MTLHLFKCKVECKALNQIRSMTLSNPDVVLHQIKTGARQSPLSVGQIAKAKMFQIGWNRHLML